tara:strand:- start:2353 stop:4299 length:1947 start_codon:yes stop_codon:yes gene_type:complete
MLNFKEYTLMSFQNIFEERFKNHFLKYGGKDIFKYQFSTGFLESLSIGDNNEKAIKYFVNLIDTNKIYTDLYNQFLAQPDTTLQTRNRYVFAAYYMKLGGVPVGIPDIDEGLNEPQNGFIALKEIFANELYKHLLILNRSKKAPKGVTGDINKIKELITKTFVPDGQSDADIGPPKYHLGFTSNNQANFYNFYTYAGRLLIANSSQTNVIKNVAERKLEPLYIGINLDKLSFESFEKFPQKASLYNNFFLSFQKRLFNSAQLQTNVNLANPTDPSGIANQDAQNSAYLPDTKGIDYFDHLSKKGAAVEFYFKFNNVFTYENTETIVTDKYKTQSLLNGYENEKYAKKIPFDYNYFSFREMLSYCLFLKTLLVKIPDPTAPPIRSTPELLMKADPAINFRFGARLVVNSPLLESQLTSKLSPVPNPYFENFESPAPFQNEVNLAAVQPQALQPNLYKLLAAAKEYGSKNDISSVWKNKAFVYNLLETELGQERTFVFPFNIGASYNTNPFFNGPVTYSPKLYNIKTQNVLPLAEFEIELTDNENKNFLNQIRDSEFIDFAIDEEIVSKYYSQVLDGLFETEIVKDYCLSDVNSLDAIASQYLDDPALYDQATKGTILVGDDPTLISEAKKMDDIIDQNLITLIDSVEAV